MESPAEEAEEESLAGSQQQQQQQQQQHQQQQPQNEVIGLNVGGKHFASSRGTLCRDPNSMLGAMFSGHFLPGRRDSRGRVFIDRDGDLFGHVLNYLRTLRLDLPASFDDHARLLTEAEYFGLTHLQELLCHRQQSPVKRCYLELWLMESADSSLEQFYHPHYARTKTVMRVSGPDCIVRRLEQSGSCVCQQQQQQQPQVAMATTLPAAVTHSYRVMRLELPSNDAKLVYLSRLDSLGCSVVSHSASICADPSSPSVGGKSVHRSFEQYILQYCYVDPGALHEKENCQTCQCAKWPLGGSMAVEKSIPILID